MDLGYGIILLLILVHGAAGVFLYVRARREPAAPEEPQGVFPEEPDEVP